LRKEPRGDATLVRVLQDIYSKETQGPLKALGIKKPSTGPVSEAAMKAITNLTSAVKAIVDYEANMAAPKTDDVLAVDIAKSYTTCLLTNKYHYPRYIASDQPERYTGGPIISCGEYLVDAFDIPQMGGVAFKKQLWTAGVVKWLLDKKWLDKSAIKYEYKPALMIHKDTFKKATRELKEIVPDGFKAAVNCMIGLLGRKFHKKVNSFMCATQETAASAYIQGHLEGQDVSFHASDGLYVVTHKSKTRLKSDNTPIHRQVICNGIMAVLQMLEKYWVPGQSHLLGVKTDAIWVKYPRTSEILEGYRVENSPPPEPSVHKPRREFNHTLLGTSDWEDVPEDQHATLKSA
jgi:hypothetical protein